jgi:NAD(P)-dependent dehydrogenase (short-subunit alcohol dehydrogenase family)
MTAPILVFGSTGGIGSALVRRLHAAKTPVFLAGRDRARLAALSADIGDAPYHAGNITDPAAIDATVAAAATDGTLGGVAYCVGSIVVKPLRHIQSDDFLDAFRLNTLGAALAIKAAERALKAGKGSVVLFSTIAADYGFPNHTVIATAKGAVEGLMRALAADLAPDVRVNCVAPSLVRTPLSAPLTRNDTMANAIAQLHPLPRLGAPEDIAAAAAYLLGPDSAWVTGQVLAVDGGRSRIRTKG